MATPNLRRAASSRAITSEFQTQFVYRQSQNKNVHQNVKRCTHLTKNEYSECTFQVLVYSSVDRRLVTKEKRSKKKKPLRPVLHQNDGARDVYTTERNSDVANRHDQHVGEEYCARPTTGPICRFCARGDDCGVFDCGAPLASTWSAMYVEVCPPAT